MNTHWRYRLIAHRNFVRNILQVYDDHSFYCSIAFFAFTSISSLYTYYLYLDREPLWTCAYFIVNYLILAVYRHRAAQNRIALSLVVSWESSERVLFCSTTRFFEVPSRRAGPIYRVFPNSPWTQSSSITRLSSSYILRIPRNQRSLKSF